MRRGDLFRAIGLEWCVDAVDLQLGIVQASARTPKPAAVAPTAKVPCDCPLWGGCQRKDVHR